MLIFFAIIGILSTICIIFYLFAIKFPKIGNFIIININHFLKMFKPIKEENADSESV